MEEQFLYPSKECDLVMKGGITSGIVYPPVVLKLAGEGGYRFRSVGGTSAGAIAAAVTAAAEYGREQETVDAQGQRQGGFERFAQLSAELRQPEFLFNLFQPDPDLKPLMYTLLELLGKVPSEPNQPSAPQPQRHSLLNRVQSLAKTLKKYNPTVGVGETWGLIVSLGLALILTVITSVIFSITAQATGDSFNLWSSVILFVALSGILIALERWLKLGVLLKGGIDLYSSLFHTLPKNLFGICSGHQLEPNHTPLADPTVLTDWLSVKINHLAGIEKTGRPLTFGDLRNKPFADRTQPNRVNGEMNIDLRMVTSNLSHNQPYVLPFEPDHLFIFNQAEFSALFPSNVVKHLIETGTQERAQFRLPDPYYFLPNPDDLPVIVATRMSLSFPLLISAIPLYTIRQSAFQHRHNDKLSTLQATDLQKNWFSDGGISSNFPIHFFDAWLPTRPTFGINLTSVSPEVLQGQSAHSEFRPYSSDYLSTPSNSANLSVEMSQKTGQTLNQEVYLPEANAMQFPEWVDINTNLFTFIWQIFLTAQNYRDTTQSNLPGYRERIVQLRLSDNEGGLNLAMDTATIAQVMTKGDAAGNLLCKNFNFEHHQWVRFRVLMGLLEEKLGQMEKNALSSGKFDFEKLLQTNQSCPYSYPVPDTLYVQKAMECVDRIRASVQQYWCEAGSPSLNDQAPQPEAALRTTPQL